MSNALYRTTGRELLKAIAAFQAGFHPAAVVLEGLTEETARPHGLPHSIADIVAHMCYWQDFFNRAAKDGYSGFSAHAGEGWPQATPGAWNDLRNKYLASVEETQQLAMTSPRLDEKLLPDGSPLWFWERESLGSGLLHAAVHSSHHLGQVVTLRQLMGCGHPRREA
ncbi:MAG: DinB family protein [Bryobacteraceae bacterium]